MFTTYKAQEYLEVDCYRIRGKGHSLLGYVGIIIVTLRREPVNNLVIGEASSWKGVPQFSGPYEEDARVELKFNQMNTSAVR